MFNEHISTAANPLTEFQKMLVEGSNWYTEYNLPQLYKFHIKPWWPKILALQISCSCLPKDRNSTPIRVFLVTVAP